MSRIDRDIRKLRDKAAELIAPGFTYYEQELIRRVIKSVLPQMVSGTDISTAKGILNKTEWLDD